MLAALYWFSCGLNRSRLIKFPQNVVGFAAVRPGKVGWEEEEEENEYLTYESCGSDKAPAVLGEACFGAGQTIKSGVLQLAKPVSLGLEQGSVRGGHAAAEWFRAVG